MMILRDGLLKIVLPPTWRACTRSQNETSAWQQSHLRSLPFCTDVLLLKTKCAAGKTFEGQKKLPTPSLLLLLLLILMLLFQLPRLLPLLLPPLPPPVVRLLVVRSLIHSCTHSHTLRL